MTDEELEELKVLNYAHDFINMKAAIVIQALTSKALSLTMEEKDRLVTLGRREGVMNFVQTLNERQSLLAAKKQKES